MMTPVKLIGFELELACAYSEFDRIWDSLYQFNSKIDLSGDASIRCKNGFRDIEIKTLPLPPTKAFNLLSDLFFLIDVLSQSDLVYANNSCGFHFSVSFDRGIDLFKVYSNILRNYPDLKYLKKFGRQNNETCFPLGETLQEYGYSKKRLARDLKIGNYRIEFANDEAYAKDYYERAASYIGGEKYVSVSLRNDGATDAPIYKRIENRIIGGKDYYKRLSDIELVINDFLDFFEKDFEVDNSQSMT